MRFVLEDSSDNFLLNAQEYGGHVSKSLIIKVKPLEKARIHIGDDYILCNNDEYREVSFKKSPVLALIVIKCISDLSNDDRRTFELSNAKLGEVRFCIGGTGIDDRSKKLPPTIFFEVFVSSDLFNLIYDNYLSEKKIEAIDIQVGFPVMMGSNQHHLWDIQQDINKSLELSELNKFYTRSGSLSYWIDFEFREVEILSHKLGIGRFEITLQSSKLPSFFASKPVSESWGYEFNRKKSDNLQLSDFFLQTDYLVKIALFFFTIICFLLVLILIFK